MVDYCVYLTYYILPFKVQNTKAQSSEYRHLRLAQVSTFITKSTESMQREFATISPDLHNISLVSSIAT